MKNLIFTLMITVTSMPTFCSEALPPQQDASTEEQLAFSINLIERLQGILTYEVRQQAQLKETIRQQEAIINRQTAELAQKNAALNQKNDELAQKEVDTSALRALADVCHEERKKRTKQTGRRRHPYQR
jgi:hypothetical protein